MSSTLPTSQLGSVAQIVAGQSPPGKEILNYLSGLPFHQGVRDFGRRFPTSRTFCEAPPRRAQPGDVLLSVRAPIGRINIADVELGIGRGLMAVRGSEKLDTDFLSYFLESMESYWGAHESSGSVFANLGKSQLSRMEVPTPSLGEQKRIAATLGALDDKMESNRRANELSFAIFKAKFLNALATASDEVPLGKLVSITKGRSYKSVELAESDTALVTLKNVGRTGDYQPRGLKSYVGPYKEAQAVSPGEIVVAQTDLTQNAEVVGRAIRIPESDDYSTLVASLDLAVVRPIGDMSQELLLGYLTYEPFRQHCRQHTTGTTVLHLAKDAIPTWPAPLVSAPAQLAFSESVRPLLGYMDKCGRENVRLAALRNALMPGLLSGRIRTTEIGDAVEEALS